MAAKSTLSDDELVKETGTLTINPSDPVPDPDPDPDPDPGL